MCLPALAANPDCETSSSRSRTNRKTLISRQHPSSSNKCHLMTFGPPRQPTLPIIYGYVHASVHLLTFLFIYGVVNLLYKQLMTPFSLRKKTSATGGFASSLKRRGSLSSKNNRNSSQKVKKRLGKISFTPFHSDKLLLEIFARVSSPQDRIACLLVCKKWSLNMSATLYVPSNN